MKRKPLQAFLVVAITALILVFPACLRISDLAGMRLLSADLSFENPDQDDILSFQPGQPKTLASAVFSLKWPPRSILLDRVTRFWLLGSFSDHKTPPLRC
jgi:hypothetical protein